MSGRMQMFTAGSASHINNVDNQSANNENTQNRLHEQHQTNNTFPNGIEITGSIKLNGVIITTNSNGELTINGKTVQTETTTLLGSMPNRIPDPDVPSTEQVADI
jgi:hypothetical protein